MPSQAAGSQDEEAQLASGVSGHASIHSNSSSNRSSAALPVRSSRTASSGTKAGFHAASDSESLKAAFSLDERIIRDGSYALGSLAMSDRYASPSSSRKQSQRKTSLGDAAAADRTHFDSITPSSASNHPSGIAQLLKANNVSRSPSPSTSVAATPRATSYATLVPLPESEDAAAPSSSSDSSQPPPAQDGAEQPVEIPSESTPAPFKPSRKDLPDATEYTALLPRITEEPESPRWKRMWSSSKTKLSVLAAEVKPAPKNKKPSRAVWEAVKAPIPFLPSTVLGILLNLLDGVSYGLIMFPKTAQFQEFGGISVSMFFVSCIVSQCVYSSFSLFKAGNGSMMIEIVPFLHSLVFGITESTSPEKIIPTVMVAFALSSIITGLVFFALGALRSGRLLEFFPRHVLCGCIGGIGAFLFITGLQVTARFDETNLPDLNFATILDMLSMPLLPLWSIPLVLAIILRELSIRFPHPLIMPSFFTIVTALFYLIALFGFRVSLAQLQSSGWVFELSAADAKAPFYQFWSEFSLRNTDFGALFKTLPTQAALVFFAILHVPLNVPALALSLGEDNVSTDRELINHGISNLLAGCIGTIPNYLCYTNSVLFYRVGGNTRLSGFMLAAATLGIMLVGPQIIGLLPVMVVGTLIYLLGLDLMKEALVDTLGKVSKFEYATILAIVLVMTFVDFVVGVGVGILLACVSFVIISSRRASVRQILSGKYARSTVRRHPQQARFLEEVGSQIRVIKLQGAIFFGTASSCEATIRSLLDEAQWASQPIRYMVLDLCRCTTVDYSASEAFVRILRLCTTRKVVLVLCGVTPKSAVGQALRGVGLWPGMQDEGRLEVFETLNSALEACENWQLRALYSRDLAPPEPDVSGVEGLMIGVDDSQPASALQSPSDFSHSPRRSAMFAAAQSNLHGVFKESPRYDTKMTQPLPLLIASLSDFAPDISDPAAFFHKVAPYLTRMHVEAGTRLWNVGDQSNSFYLIEAGVLRSSKHLDDLSFQSVETMLPATVCGMLAFLSGCERTSLLTVERNAVLWRLDADAYVKMQKELPLEHMSQLRKIFAKLVHSQQELLLSHLATTV